MTTNVLKFTIQCEMHKRWVPYFLAMLEYIQYCGSVGKSRRVGLYADGDGDFQPQFNWDEKLPSDAKPKTDDNGHRLYDAG